MDCNVKMLIENLQDFWNALPQYEGVEDEAEETYEKILNRAKDDMGRTYSNRQKRSKR